MCEKLQMCLLSALSTDQGSPPQLHLRMAQKLHQVPSYNQRGLGTGILCCIQPASAPPRHPPAHSPVGCLPLVLTQVLPTGSEMHICWQFTIVLGAK